MQVFIRLCPVETGIPGGVDMAYDRIVKRKNTVGIHVGVLVEKFPKVALSVKIVQGIEKCGGFFKVSNDYFRYRV